MKTSLFDFHLPGSLIASRPATPRDSARMLVVHESLQDKQVRDLPAFLEAGDLLVFNDSKVIPARLFGSRGAAKVEVLLHKHAGEGRWQCFARPAKKLKPGDRITFADNFSAAVEAKLETGEVILRFSSLSSPWKGEDQGGGLLRNETGPPPGLPLAGGGDFYSQLETHGHIPLPPYISRADDAQDRADYQTIYAREKGSVAAPTAGLHFTPALLEALAARRVGHTFVTLHVGGGTFLPVKAEDTAEHKMHSEYAEVSAEAAAAINAAKRVIAVGTTSLRTLESAADENGQVQPFCGETDIFITPGYQFRAVDMLLTNFHLPKSTLFMLTCAFAGMERMQAAYAHAIAEKYRFYSYGDASLLYRNL